jgi:hypothetical protein
MQSQLLPTSVSGFLRQMALDPVLFARTMLPKAPHPGQVAWLRGSTESVNTLVPANRWGKSTVIAMKQIWKCWGRIGANPFEKKYETISVAMSADQAMIVFDEARTLLRGSPLMAPFVKSYRETPFPHIVFTNGSVRHCRSAHDGGKYIDGHAYRYLSIDEAGWITDLKNLMNNVIVMRLAGGGEIDLVGTPKGFGDLYFYYERGIRGMNGYYSQRGRIWDNPFLPPADIKKRDAILQSGSPKLRMQVLEGEFVDFAGLAFSRDQRDNAFVKGMPYHQDWLDGHRYVTAWDLGRTTDYTVGVTLDITTRPWQLVDFTRLNRVPWEEIYATIDRVRKEYHCSFARIDATGPLGDVVEEEMFKRGIRVDPFKSNTKTIKVDLINSLQNALDHDREQIDEALEFDEHGVPHRVPIMEEPDVGNWGLLRMPLITQLMDEMGVYQFDDKELVTDSVMALALAADLAYQTEAVREPVLGGLYG